MANQWLTGSGVPSTGIGQVTDYYRDTVNNLVYYRENAFTWVVVPAFTPSPDGIGTTWLHGATAPLTAQGSDGDYFYEDTHKIVYRKEGSTWVAKGSLDFIGIYGVQWGNGLGAPVSSVPLDTLPAGSFYLDVVTSDIYYKGPSMSWELKGQLGGGGGGGGSSINLITTLEEVTELDVTSAITPSVIYDLDLLKAPLESPAFTGTPTAPTPQTEPSLDNSTNLATTEFVNVVANAAVATANSYADSLLTSVYKFQSTYNPQTTGNFPTTANTVGGVDIAKCFTWVIAGLSGQYTFQGVTVDNGDTLLSLVDNASATVSSDWHITEKNLGYTPENVNNKVANLTVPSDTTFPSTNAVITGLGTKEPTLPTNLTSSKFLREDRTWQVVPTKAQVYTTGSNYAVGDTVNHLGSTWTCNTAITSAPATMLVTSWDLTGLGAVRGFSSAFDITQTNYTDDGGGNSGRSFVFSGSTFTLRNSSNVNLKIGSKVVVNCFTGGGTVNIASEAGVTVIGGVTSGVQTITCVKIATDAWLTYR